MKVLAGGVAVLGVLLGACASHPPIPISDEDYDHVAMSLASTLRPAGGGGELGALLDVGLIARGGTPAGFELDSQGHLHGQHLGLAYRYELECRDAHNRVLATCDARTANADVRVTWSGVLTLPYLVMVIERDGAWIINDITDDTLRVDGEGHLTHESRITNPERGAVTSYALAYRASHRRIVLGKGERFPRTGTVLYDLEVRRARTGDPAGDPRELSLDAELRFLPGGAATLELDGARTYRLDLVDGSLVLVE